MAGRDEDYDRFLTIFSPDGHLYQIEYALKAVNQPGVTSVGLRGKGCVVTVTEKKVKDKLIDPVSVTNMYKITPKIGCLVTGMHADGVSTVSQARQEAENFEYENGYPIPCSYLASRVAQQFQVNTQHAGARTMGVDLMLSAVDEEQGPQLFKIDPSGMSFSYLGTSSGEKRAEATSLLERKVAENGDMDDETTIRTAIMVLQQTLSSDFKPSEIEVGYCTGKERFRQLSEEEIEGHLVAIAERD